LCAILKTLLSTLIKVSADAAERQELLQEVLKRKEEAYINK
jgi:hypothetical protein